MIDILEVLNLSSKDEVRKEAKRILGDSPEDVIDETTTLAWAEFRIRRILVELAREIDDGEAFGRKVLTHLLDDDEEPGESGRANASKMEHIRSLTCAS